MPFRQLFLMIFEVVPQFVHQHIIAHERQQERAALGIIHRNLAVSAKYILYKSASFHIRLYFQRIDIQWMSGRVAVYEILSVHNRKSFGTAHATIQFPLRLVLLPLYQLYVKPSDDLQHLRIFCPYSIKTASLPISVEKKVHDLHELPVMVPVRLLFHLFKCVIQLIRSG